MASFNGLTTPGTYSVFLFFLSFSLSFFQRWIFRRARACKNRATLPVFACFPCFVSRKKVGRREGNVFRPAINTTPLSRVLLSFARHHDAPFHEESRRNLAEWSSLFAVVVVRPNSSLLFAHPLARRLKVSNRFTLLFEIRHSTEQGTKRGISNETIVLETFEILARSTYVRNGEVSLSGGRSNDSMVRGNYATRLFAFVKELFEKFSSLCAEWSRMISRLDERQISVSDKEK